MHLERFVRLPVSCKKVMGWCTAQRKMLLLCENHRKRLTHFWTSPSEEEHFACLATFRFGNFVMPFRAIKACCRSWSTRKQMVCCHKGLEVYRLRKVFVLAYIACPRYLYIYGLPTLWWLELELGLMPQILHMYIVRHTTNLSICYQEFVNLLLGSECTWVGTITRLDYWTHPNCKTPRLVQKKS